MQCEKLKCGAGGTEGFQGLIQRCVHWVNEKEGALVRATGVKGGDLQEWWEVRGQHRVELVILSILSLQSSHTTKLSLKGQREDRILSLLSE